MTDYILVYLVLIIGSCLQSVIGFGLGLLGAPLIFLIMPELVPGPMILNALLLTTLLAVKHQYDIGDPVDPLYRPCRTPCQQTGPDPLRLS